MQKRGQVSVFAIVGVILVILVALFFFARNQYGIFIEPTKFLNDKSKPIEDNLKDCVNEVVSKSLDSFGKQGGVVLYSSLNNFKLYQGFSVPYYCTDIPGVPNCMNLMPTLGDAMLQFNSKISQEVSECIDKGLLENGLGYSVNAGELNTDVSLVQNGILVSADYDVKIIKGDVKTSINPINVRFDVPYEELYSVAVDIVNAEARSGSFEQLLYMLNERGKYEINLDKPYPDKIYKINKKDNDFELWFAVQGERGV